MLHVPPCAGTHALAARPGRAPRALAQRQWGVRRAGQDVDYAAPRLPLATRKAAHVCSGSVHLSAGTAAPADHSSEQPEVGCSKHALSQCVVDIESPADG